MYKRELGGQEQEPLRCEVPVSLIEELATILEQVLVISMMEIVMLEEDLEDGNAAEQGEGRHAIAVKQRSLIATFPHTREYLKALIEWADPEIEPEEGETEPFVVLDRITVRMLGYMGLHALQTYEDGRVLTVLAEQPFEVLQNVYQALWRLLGYDEERQKACHRRWDERGRLVIALDPDFNRRMEEDLARPVLEWRPGGLSSLAPDDVRNDDASNAAAESETPFLDALRADPVAGVAFLRGMVEDWLADDPDAGPDGKNPPPRGTGNAA